MTFTLLGGGTVAALCVVGAGVMVALYLLRLQRRRVEIHFAALWQKVLVERESMRFFRRIKRWVSLLVQVLLLSCLIVALADPTIGPMLPGRNVVILLDSSASMNATDVRPNRMERAKEEARKVVREMAHADWALVIQMDEAPQAIGPWDADGARWVKRIDHVSAGDAVADIDRALDMAQDALRGREHPVIVLIGDSAGVTPRDLKGVDVRFVSIGSQGDNVAITAFAGRRRPSDRRRFDLYVELESFRATAIDVTLEILASGTVVDRRAISIAPGASVAQSYGDFGARGGPFEARAIMPPGTDHLAADNHAFARVPERKRRRVLLVSEGNLFLEGALLADADVEFDRIPPSSYREDSAHGYDVALFDRFLTESPPRVRGALYVGLLEERTERTLSQPILDFVASDHPVMKRISLRDVNVGRATRVALDSGDSVLAASVGAPLIVARQSDNGLRSVWVGFDVRESDLPLRAAFPLLMANALDWFVRDDVAELGELAFAGTLPRVESRIAPETRWVVGQRTATAPERRPRGVRRHFWIYLAGLALAIVMVEWFTYHRRVTV